MITRRGFMGSMLSWFAGASAVPLLSNAQASDLHVENRVSSLTMTWRPGIDGQRRADLGNGQYLNPILSGDYPDPAILKDGDDYYMTHSSFDAVPGLVIWHSRDLVNWTPLGPALQNPPGTVFAVDIAKHNGRYYIYIPFMKASWSTELSSFANIYVIHADSMAGPWSEPVDLNIRGLIDPGHAVGEDGQRYLFLSGINRIRLSPDGLATVGEVEKVYDGWRYPDTWITEGYSLEGPKLFRRGDYFYLVSAVGGTSGPPTGHMVIVARAKSIHGPWINCPHNPIVRTASKQEAWWSRGHATMVEGPGAKWFMVYHGYEKDFRTLGRQCLLEPMTWSEEGWPLAQGGDLSSPLLMPLRLPDPQHGIARSDDFTQSAFGVRWSFFGGSPDEYRRVMLREGRLELRGKGSSPADASPLTQCVGERAYEITVDMEIIGHAQGGLLLFYDARLFLGMGHDGEHMITWRGGQASFWQEPAPAARHLSLRIVNDSNIVTFYYRTKEEEWVRHAIRSEVSGYNANTMDDLSSLRPALYAAGEGSIRFSNFRFCTLPETVL